MGELLSQAEIEALLNGGALPDDATPSAPDEPGGQANDDRAQSGQANSDRDDLPGLDDKEFIVGEDPGGEFTDEEIDALGEIGNISMGNSATTLFSLLSRKVNITTPTVSVSTLRDIAASYKAPLVVVRVEYTEGLLGSNMIVLKESDVMSITDLMMGGDGTNIDGDITELHLSAISEAMNQMIGNASTSLSNIFEKKIDISPPNAMSVKINDGSMLLHIINIEPEEKVAVVSFEMIVEGLLDTRIMQILPITFAKDLINQLIAANMPKDDGPSMIIPPPQVQAPQAPAQYAPQPGPSPQGLYPQPGYAQQQEIPQQAPPQYAPPQGYPQQGYSQQMPPPSYVNVQPANFQSFEDAPIVVDKKNIGLVMDVNLEVSVELGRTHKLIREILEFGQGTIIELDKLAGEPVDILVNGKIIAKGEVVVIDESFAVRVTDIIHPSKRI